jgi:hypothetical protein
MNVTLRLFEASKYQTIYDLHWYFSPLFLRLVVRVHWRRARRVRRGHL